MLLYRLQRATCIGKLTRAFHKQNNKECQNMIDKIKEGRYQNTLEWQRTKFNVDSKISHKQNKIFSC